METKRRGGRQKQRSQNFDKFGVVFLQAVPLQLARPSLVKNTIDPQWLPFDVYGCNK
jgi:hypothetical protein